MYVYDFDTDPNAAISSLVNQTNSGPVCFFCGAVMVDNKTRILMLTKYIASLSAVNTTDNTIVQPYIFDFKTLSWSIDNRFSILDESLKHVFQVRHQHATDLGDNGLIYTIGDADYFQLYEPEKDPNRVVYLNETIDGLDIETIDKWLDVERAGHSKSEVMNQVLSVYPDSYVSLQFDIVNILKIDLDSNWHFSLELNITHTDVLNRDTLFVGLQTFSSYLDEIQLFPAGFKVKNITEKRDVTVINTIGVNAGIVSMLLAFCVFLFGAKLTNLWGCFKRRLLFEEIKSKRLDRKIRKQT